MSKTANYSTKRPDVPVAAATKSRSAASVLPNQRGAPIGILLFLAWRALGENILSLVLLLLAVAIGVGFPIPNRANLAGFRDEIMRQEVSSGLGHVRVRPRQGERFGDVTAMLARIALLPSVKAVEPILVLPGVIKKGSHLVVLGITGVTTSAREHPYERTAGADLAPRDDHGALLGERLAKKLGANVGDEVSIQVLLSTRPRLVLDDEGVGNYTLTVRGLAGSAALDSVFVNWGFLASETGDDRSASALLIWAKSDDVNMARQIASTIEHDFPDATALSWLDDSRYLRSIVGAVQALESIAGGMSLFGVIIPVLSPALILADEPTGSLDSAATEAVLDSFDEIVREGTTLVVATHDARVAGRMRQIIHMRDGTLGTAPGHPAHQLDSIPALL